MSTERVITIHLPIGCTWTLELKCYPANMLRAISDGLHELPAEQARSGCPHGAVIVKRWGVWGGTSERQRRTLRRRRDLAPVEDTP